MTTMTAGAVRYGAPMELKATGDAWTVEGWVSCYSRDLVDDEIVPGAYRRTLADGHKVRFLYSHQQDKVLGVPLELREDGRKGLFGRFKISRTPLGEEVRQLLLDGALDAFSVGYVATDYENDRDSGVRKLKEIELLECSIVAMPAQPSALVTSAKAAPSGYAKRLSPQLRRVLATIERSEQREDWNRTKAQIKAMRVRLGY
jgi:hypothetical protein